MNDYRAAGQELQSQVLAAARKGQQRVASTVKNVTAAAQHIKPQLASLPKPTLNISALPGQAQLREKAPALVARLPGNLQTKLPTPDQLKAGAQGLADQARHIQRRVLEQVRTVATPLAHQAAERLSQFAESAPAPAPGAKTETTTKVSEVTVSGTQKAKAETARPKSATARAKAETAKGPSPRKPRAKTTDK